MLLCQIKLDLRSTVEADDGHSRTVQRASPINCTDNTLNHWNAGSEQTKKIQKKIVKEAIMAGGR